MNFKTQFIHKWDTAVFEWWCQLWLFETIFVEEIQQNQPILYVT